MNHDSQPQMECSAEEPLSSQQVNPSCEVSSAGINRGGGAPAHPSYPHGKGHQQPALSSISGAPEGSQKMEEAEVAREPRVLSLGEALHRALNLPIDSVERETGLMNAWYAAIYGIIETGKE